MTFWVTRTRSRKTCPSSSRTHPPPLRLWHHTQHHKLGTEYKESTNDIGSAEYTRPSNSPLQGGRRREESGPLQRHACGRLVARRNAFRADVVDSKGKSIHPFKPRVGDLTISFYERMLELASLSNHLTIGHFSVTQTSVCRTRKSVRHLRGSPSSQASFMLICSSSPASRCASSVPSRPVSAVDADYEDMNIGTATAPDIATRAGGRPAGGAV